MNLKNKQRVLLLLGASLLGALSWRAVQRQAEIERVQAQLDALARPLVSPLARGSSAAEANEPRSGAIRSGPASASAAEHRRAAFQQVLAELRSAATPRGRQPRLLPPTRMWIVLPELMTDPDYARLEAFRRESQMRLNLHEQFLGALELDVETRAKLVKAFIEFDAGMRDLRSLEVENGLDSENTSRRVRKALLQLRGDLHEEFDRSARAVLGEEKHAQFRPGSLAVRREIVDALERRLSYSPTPLAAEQAAGLMKLLASVPRDEGRLPTLKTLSDEVLAQAQSILSPSQSQALAQLRTEARALDRMSEILGRPAVAMGWGG